MLNKWNDFYNNWLEKFKDNVSKTSKIKRFLDNLFKDKDWIFKVYTH